jgi:hypothetical protein
VGKKASKKSITSSPVAAIVKKNLPPLRLSAEEMVARAKMAETLQGWRRELDRALIAEARGWPRSSSSSSSPRRSRIQEVIRQFVIDKFGSNWQHVTMAAIIKAASEDEDFNRLVRPFPNRSTFERALGRKKH